MIDTEVEVASPEFRMGPVSDITAGTVTVKTEEFPLPANALVSQSPCMQKAIFIPGGVPTVGSYS